MTNFKALFNNLLTFIKRNKFKSVFFITGFLSTIWFLIRVIPKPQRATYPCMRTAFPIASSFVLYIAGLTGSVFFFKRFYKYLLEKKFLYASLILLMTVTTITSALIINSKNNKVYAQGRQLTILANDPVGEAKGIFPGRVVWVHNPAATNKSCTNTANDAYFMDSNTNQSEVDKMVEAAIKSLTGKENIVEAWDTIFRYHNVQTGRGNAGYQNGEKIFIKINATSTWNQNIDFSDFSRITTDWDGESQNPYFALYETTPQIILSVLRQLADNAGVFQQDIYIGDPMKHIYQDIYEKLTAEFPNVHYLDNSSDYDGREVVEASSTALIKYSDRGDIISEQQDHLYTIYENMDYMINIPCMKGHKYGGITMFAKNHFGSITAGGASHLHPGLIKDDYGNTRNGYGLYRVQVDLMGHELLGKKNLFYLMDALYSTKEELDKPDKWAMVPFNNNWTSSVFLSLDPVAIESVGYDFLRSEYNGTNDNPMMSGADDYLRQAADPSNWAAGITYDPENNGSALQSLGVNERWNDATSKQYSRNLGSGDGIELVYELIGTNNIGSPKLDNTNISLNSVYPNPFNNNLTVEYNINSKSDLVFRILNINGQEIYYKGLKNINQAGKLKIDIANFTVKPIKGQYILVMEVNSKGNKTSYSRKIICE